MGRAGLGGSKGEGRKKNIIKLVILAAALVIIIAGLKFTGKSDSSVGFTQLTEEAVPQDIISQVIPEYRDMERALACLVEDKIYVFACRGEKPTTGYDISIESMEINEKDKEKTLTVNVLFTDPQAGASLTQEVTYPYVVAETDLLELPDKIEMKIAYAD